MKEIQWRPDTCNCILTYEYDEKLPDAEKVFSGKKIVKACKEHATCKDAIELYNTIKKENSGKNVMLDDIEKTYAVPSADIAWSFDATRKLKIEVKNVDAAKKSLIDTFVSSKVDLAEEK